MYENLAAVPKGLSLKIHGIIMNSFTVPDKSVYILLFLDPLHLAIHSLFPANIFRLRQHHQNRHVYYWWYRNKISCKITNTFRQANNSPSLW